jgi:hypothetical protein
MSARNVVRVVAVTLGITTLLVLVLLLLLKWHFTRERSAHEAPIKALVTSRATKAEVRDRLRDPPFVGSAERREHLGRDLLSFWAMSSTTRDRIERGLKDHPETWVYWSTYVDFLFFDSSGRLAGYETISN